MFQSASNTLQALSWRYAVKEFDATRTIPADTWSALEETLVLAPSSFGLQTWKFFVISDRARREKLVPIAWNQRQVADASHLVVLAAPLKFEQPDIDRWLARTAEVKGATVESLGGFGKMMSGMLLKEGFPLDLWMRNQVYLALGFFLASAAVMGIDTCPMEGFVPEALDAELGLTALGYRSVVLAPAGYRAESDRYGKAPKVRYAKSDVVAHLS